MSIENEERLSYTLPEVARMMGLSNNVIRHYIKVGKIHAMKIGGKYIIPAKELNELLRG
jgi:excisionase family DNA binding protein